MIGGITDRRRNNIRGPHPDTGCRHPVRRPVRALLSASKDATQHSNRLRTAFTLCHDLHRVGNPLLPSISMPPLPDTKTTCPAPQFLSRIFSSHHSCRPAVILIRASLSQHPILPTLLLLQSLLFPI